MDMCKRTIAANKTDSEDESEDDGDAKTNELESLIDSIYADNKKKSQATNALLQPLSAKGCFIGCNLWSL